MMGHKQYQPNIKTSDNIMTQQCLTGDSDDYGVVCKCNGVIIVI